MPATLLNLLQSSQQSWAAPGRRSVCRSWGKRLWCSLLSRAQRMHVHKHRIPAVQVGAAWLYTQLIHLSPAASSEANCKNQIFPTCWRNDVVLVMGELPGEVRGEDSAPRRARAPRSSPSSLRFPSCPWGGSGWNGSSEARSEGSK